MKRKDIWTLAKAGALLSVGWVAVILLLPTFAEDFGRGVLHLGGVAIVLLVLGLLLYHKWFDPDWNGQDDN